MSIARHLNLGGLVLRPGCPVNHGRFDLVMEPALAPPSQPDQVSVVLNAGEYVISVSEVAEKIRRLAEAMDRAASQFPSHYPEWRTGDEAGGALTDEQAAKPAAMLAMPPLQSVEELREQVGLPPFPDEESVVSGRIDTVAGQVIRDAQRGLLVHPGNSLSITPGAITLNAS